MGAVFFSTLYPPHAGRDCHSKFWLKNKRWGSKIQEIKIHGEVHSVLWSLRDSVVRPYEYVRAGNVWICKRAAYWKRCLCVRIRIQDFDSRQKLIVKINWLRPILYTVIDIISYSKLFDRGISVILIKAQRNILTWLNYYNVLYKFCVL